ncbi:MAG: hypothetical protein HY701_04565 [Gemmatimonadetes bacterium]|nr:hypothetical protein [Gemmatimonadota bacterium]
MDLIRLSPFRELERIQARLNRLLDESFGREREGNGLFAQWTPAEDVQETDKEYLI